MPPRPLKLREIVREPLFEQELMVLKHDAIRADEFTEGAEFVLSRNPEHGKKVAKNVWFLPMTQPSEGGSLSLYYTFDEHHVFFLSIHPAPKEIEE